MNYKTTLIIAAIAATAFAALGSALPVFETAYASNGGGFNVEQGDACIFAGFNNCAGNINQQGENNFQQGVED